MTGAAGLGATWAAAWSGPRRLLPQFLDGEVGPSSSELLKRSAPVAGRLAARRFGPAQLEAWKVLRGALATW